MKANEASASHFDGLFIGIPSLSRPTAIQKKTLALVKDAGIPYKIFVEPQEAFLYGYYCGKDNVFVLNDSHRGIGYSRQSMMDYARSHGFKYIMELDDDVDSFERIDNSDKFQSFIMTISDCYNAMERYERLGGIRFALYRFWLYTKKDMYKWNDYNCLLMGNAFLRVSALKEKDSLADIPHYEDTINSLHILQNGYFTLNYGLSGLRVLFNQGAGGCNSGERQELCLKAVDVIRKEFPRTLTKENKTWGVDVDVKYYLEMYGRQPIKCRDDEELDAFLRKISAA